MNAVKGVQGGTVFVTCASLISLWDHFSSCPATPVMLLYALTVPLFHVCNRNSFEKPFLTTKSLGMKSDCWGSNPSSINFQLCDLDSMPRFPHLENEGGASAYLIGLLWGLNVGTHVMQLHSAWHIISTQQSLDFIITVTIISSISLYDSESHLLCKAYLTDSLCPLWPPISLKSWKVLYSYESEFVPSSFICVFWVKFPNNTGCNEPEIMCSIWFAFSHPSHLLDK